MKEAEVGPIKSETKKQILSQLVSTDTPSLTSTTAGRRAMEVSTDGGESDWFFRSPLPGDTSSDEILLSHEGKETGEKPLTSSGRLHSIEVEKQRKLLEMTDEEMAKKLMTPFREIRTILLKSLERPKSANTTHSQLLNDVLDDVHRIMTSTLQNIQVGLPTSNILKNSEANEDSNCRSNMNQADNIPSTIPKIHQCTHYIDKVDLLARPYVPIEQHTCSADFEAPTKEHTGCCFIGLARGCSKMLKRVVEKIQNRKRVVER